MGTYVLPPARYTDTTSIKAGSCVRQFNVIICGQSHKAVSINHNLCPQTINMAQVRVYINMAQVQVSDKQPVRPSGKMLGW